MRIHFYKYSGLGNTFVLIETRNSCLFRKNKWSKIAKMICNISFGVGSNGLIIFDEGLKTFEMTTLNPDGSYASLCGNAMRCAAQHFFTKYNKNLLKCSFRYRQVFTNRIEFLACEGKKSNLKIAVSYQINLNHKGPYKIFNQEWYYVNSGTDHAITFLDNMTMLNEMNVNKIGRKIRYHEKFKPRGVNANFVFKDKNNFFLRTYERGVEDETLSCATGSIATVIADMIKSNQRQLKAKVIQKSNKVLEIDCKIINGQVSIEQSGEALLICEGDYEL